jgi:predicted GNAT superfamily acetyltransferase
MSYSIQRLETLEHYHAAEEVQRRAWSILDDTEVVPSHLLMTAQKNGGLVLGAFDEEGRMIGFLFGFLGRTEEGRLKHCSHMMGVLPDVQGQGVGYGLKLRQREFALSQGLDLVTWTYDPLEGLNAFLNIAKLGVISHTYLRDAYGQIADELNVGLSSDRFRVEWWIRSRRVEERLAQGGKRLRLEGAYLANTTERDRSGLLRPADWDRSPTAEALLVEIPARIQAIKAADMDLAQEWRAHTRQVFESYFAAGYTVCEFISQVQGDQRRNFYLLRRDFVVE